MLTTHGFSIVSPWISCHNLPGSLSAPQRSVPPRESRRCAPKSRVASPVLRPFAGFTLALCWTRVRVRARQALQATIQWPEETAPILTREQEKSITRAVMAKFNFRRLTADESTQARFELPRFAKGTSPDSFTDTLVENLRRSVQIQAALKYTYRSKGRFQSNIRRQRQVAEKSDQMVLPGLSEKLCVPPINLLKAMMTPEDLPVQSPFKIFRALEVEKFTSQEEVQEILSRKLGMNIKNSWFLRELLWAFENDHEALQISTEQSSKGFEDSVIAHCQNAGASLEREKDLRSKAQVTPDVCFSSPVTFSFASRREQAFRWLECKNFHGGAENRMVVRKLKKQVQKYTKALGPGAVVFAGGAAQKVRQILEDLGVGVLDASNLSPDSTKHYQGLAVPRFVSGPKAGFWSLTSSDFDGPERFP